MKRIFRIFLVFALLVAVLNLPVIGQEEATIEATETSVPVDSVPVVEAPVVVVDTPDAVIPVVDTETAWIDGSVMVWSGWVIAIFFAAAFFFTVKELAKSGNEKAEYGLKFFEAARDMIPIDKWQQQFEIKASESITPADDLVAVVTRVVLEQIGALKTEQGEPKAASQEVNINL